MDNCFFLASGLSAVALGHCVKPGNMAQFIWLTIPLKMCRLGIELTKIMVLQYSNQETSVTIGESVRDEDGIASFFLPFLIAGSVEFPILTAVLWDFSFHPAIYKA